MGILKESRKLRIAKIKEGGTITDKYLHLHVEAYSPVLITNDDVVRKYTVNTKNAITSTATELVDVEGNVRFLHIATLESPITLNVINLYYDKVYSDIIITPDLSYYDKLPYNDYVELRCYGIGGDAIVTNKSVSQGLTVDDNLSIKLPQPNVLNGKAKVHTVTMAGLRPSNLVVVNRLQENITNDKVIVHGERSMAVLIELGTLQDLFGNKLQRLPVYLLHQTSHIEFGIRPLGRVPTGNNKLYLFIRF